MLLACWMQWFTWGPKYTRLSCESALTLESVRLYTMFSSDLESELKDQQSSCLAKHTIGLFLPGKTSIGMKAKVCTCPFLGWKLGSTAAFLGCKDSGLLRSSKSHGLSLQRGGPWCQMRAWQGVWKVSKSPAASHRVCQRGPLRLRLWLRPTL